MVRVYPVPEAIGDVTANVSEPAVELRWSPPSRTTSGAAIAALAGYRVYRAEVEPGQTESDPAKLKLKTPAELLGVSPTAAYRDAQIEFEKTYFYTVRSVAQYELDSVESADSQAVVLTLKDTFAPAAPKNLVAVYVPAAGETPAHIELSWSISPEADAAGYHVYRSEQEGKAGIQLTRELLPTPTFRDMSVATGQGYTYTVTVVDRAGNESPQSAAVAATAPNPGANEREKI
jgi:fibronectin type 3 domain-containing protein